MGKNDLSTPEKIDAHVAYLESLDAKQRDAFVKKSGFPPSSGSLDTFFEYVHLLRCEAEYLRSGTLPDWWSRTR